MPPTASQPQIPCKIFPGPIDIEKLKRASRDFMKGVKAGNRDEVNRLAKHHPKAAAQGTDKIKLSDAQNVIAREYGFKSWPVMKTHLDHSAATQIQIEAGLITVPDTPRTLHIRCGSDIRHNLELAGFRGMFLEFADPFCQGPVPDLPLPLMVQKRADFIADAYGLTPNQAMAREQAEYAALAQSGDFKHIVLWFEHDSYDQLILAFLLDFFGFLRPDAKVELICVDRVPGVENFRGLGQLEPDRLGELWEKARQPVSDTFYDLGRKVWAAIRSSDPTDLATLARSPSNTRPIPIMAGALQRHLQELPSTVNDLGLTQQLVLEILAEHGDLPAGRVFGRLMRDKDPLPWLGDTMFWHVLEDMRQTEGATLFDIDDASLPWQDRVLTLTETGAQVMRGEKRFFEFYRGTRWVGGVEVSANGPCPHWNPETRTLARKAG
jgi:hypothetical protein